MVLRMTSQGEGFGDPKRRKLNGCWDAEPYQEFAFAVPLL